MKRYLGLFYFYVNRWFNPLFKDDYFIANRNKFNQDTSGYLMNSIIFGGILFLIMSTATKNLMNVNEMSKYQLLLWLVASFWVSSKFRVANKTQKTLQQLNKNLNIAMWAINFIIVIIIFQATLSKYYLSLIRGPYSISSYTMASSLQSLGLILFICFYELVAYYYNSIAKGCNKVDTYFKNTLVFKYFNKSKPMTLQPAEKDFVLKTKSKEESDLSKILD